MLIYFFRCRASDECPGFVINYERESCFRVDTNTDDLREDLIPATSRLNYFEKVCLKGNYNLVSTKIYSKFPPEFMKKMSTKIRYQIVWISI